MTQLLKYSERLYFWCFKAIAYLCILFLIVVVVTLLRLGAPVLNWQFLTQNWNHIDITNGGIFPAIVGTVYLGIGVLVVSFPIGFATAIFLTEYTQQSIWKRIIQLAIRNLAGVPSVIYGMFGLAVFVHLFSFGTSILSAVLTLSIMTLPWIITAASESLESIPRSFREASYALGASKWQTISKVILPAALPSGITGGIIANARAMGETAPIIMVGATFFLSTLPTSPLDKFMALPYHTFILATQHSSPSAIAYASGTAFVLIMITFLLSLGAIGLRYHLRKHKEW